MAARGRSVFTPTSFSRNHASIALRTCSDTGIPSRSLISRSPSIKRLSIRRVVTCVGVIRVYHYMSTATTIASARRVVWRSCPTARCAEIRFEVVFLSQSTAKQ